MTHKLILAGNANALYPVKTTESCAIDGAGENRGRRPSDTERGVSPVSAIAQMSLILIVLLMLAHSGYWSLLLPSWLAFVAFLSGAGDSTGYEDGRAGALGVSR